MKIKREKKNSRWSWNVVKYHERKNQDWQHYTCLWLLYATLSHFTWHFPQRWHFQRTVGHVLCQSIKSPPEWQMVDQAQQGEWREGREGKGAVPQSQKCLGSEVGEASALAWGDIAALGETCCRGVCCWSFQRVGGSLSLTSGQTRSITVSLRGS